MSKSSLRLAARAGRGAPVECRGRGKTDRITISNVANGLVTPVLIRLGAINSAYETAAPRNVSVSDIVATNVSVGCAVYGVEGHAVENVRLSNINVTFVGGGTIEDPASPIPSNPDSPSEHGLLPCYGLYCSHVNGLTLRDLDFRCEQGDYQPAILLEAVSELRLNGHRTRDNSEGIALRHVLRLHAGT